MSDNSKYVEIDGQFFRQIGITSILPEDDKTYGLKRDGHDRIAKLVEIDAGDKGTTNYEQLENLPSINGKELIHNVSLEDIGAQEAGNYATQNDLDTKANVDDFNVFKAETAELIANKQDKLTPVAPITINKYVKSNLHGFSFTTDGTGVYATSGKSLSYMNFDSQSQGKMIFRNNTVISSADESWACYIDVPISLGQVVKFPVPDANNYGYPMCILGKTDATGNFTVITHGYALGYNRCNPTDDALVFDGDSVYTKNRLDYRSTSSYTDTVNNQDPYTGFVQLFEDEAGTFSIQIHKCSGASNGIPYYSTHKYVISDVSAINRFKEINTVRIVPCYYGTKNGKTADSAISVSSIGLYNCSTDLFSLNNDMSQFDTGNLFDISGETAHNYLELNLGDGLSVVDGKLQANPGELSNEVNDLSGRVTAVEADVLTKENKITTTGALTLQEKIISNLNGMEYTGDGTGVYGAYSLESTDEAFSSGNFGNNTSFGDSWTATSIPCYIDIPYTFGQIVKVPSGTYGYTWNKSIGKLLADGTFIPICTFSPSTITTSDTLKSFTRFRAEWNTKSTTKTNGDSFSVANGQVGCSYIQFIDNGSTIRFLAYYGNGEVVPSTSNNFTVTDNNDIQRIREIQVVRVFPNRGDYGVSSHPYPLDRFGLYDGATTLDTLGDFNNLGENLFDLSGQVARNYLELNIGNGLAIQNNTLVATTGMTGTATKVATLATNAELSAAVQKINEIIARLEDRGVTKA